MYCLLMLYKKTAHDGTNYILYDEKINIQRHALLFLSAHTPLKLTKKKRFDGPKIPFISSKVRKHMYNYKNTIFRFDMKYTPYIKHPYFLIGLLLSISMFRRKEKHF